jgi:hypothetical protein
MKRWSKPLLVLAPYLLFACGGGNPEPATPASTGEPAAATPAASEPAASEAKSGADGWEGESEAKDGAPAATPEAKPAPAEQQREETRTLEVIQKIVKQNRQPVRDCYEKARKDLPSLQGDMIIHFVLDPEGKVKQIELVQQRSTLKAPAVVDCAIKVIKGLSFPPSSRGMETTVNYPYNFTP